jgi:hypothetical protein
MPLASDFSMYKEEIELIRSQNRVECDLYSIIACIIRESKNGSKILLRDVSIRRTTDFSKSFKGNSGFPDFVIRTREKCEYASILGAIEVKYTDEDLKMEQHLEQLNGHREFYKKVIYTNGLKWQFYIPEELKENNNDPWEWETNLGALVNGEVIWNREDKWVELLENLDKIERFK